MFFGLQKLLCLIYMVRESIFIFDNVSYFDRQQDVRATEIDKVDMHLSFHPGDIVRALVVLFLHGKK